VDRSAGADKLRPYKRAVPVGEELASSRRCLFAAGPSAFLTAMSTRVTNGKAHEGLVSLPIPAI